MLMKRTHPLLCCPCLSLPRRLCPSHSACVLLAVPMAIGTAPQVIEPKERNDRMRSVTKQFTRRGTMPARVLCVLVVTGALLLLCPIPRAHAVQFTIDFENEPNL